MFSYARNMDHIKEYTSNILFLKKLYYFLNYYWLGFYFSNVQIDPPASSILMLKSIKLSFAFEQTWVLSGAQQGIFLHLFADFMEKLGEGLISSRIDKIFKLDRISEAHSYFQSNPTKKIVLLPATK